jgi:DHA1 family multidrug resistance protein-like MFS transporter
MRLLPVEPWRRNQAVMVATVFVVFTGFAFVLPFLPLFVRTLGVRSDEAAALWSGILIGVSPLLAGLLAPVWGRLADRTGARRVALRALASYVVLMLLSAAVTDVWQLLLLRVGVGLFGGIGPLGLAMATSLAPREETGRAVARVQAAQILSAAVGPVAGGVLADHLGVRLTFVAAAGVCAAAWLLVARAYVEAPAPARGAAERTLPLAGVVRLPEVAGLMAALFLVNFVGRSFTPILPLHLIALGLPADRVASRTGALISAYAVAAAVSASAFGRATGRFPPRLLLVASLALGTSAVLPMALVTSFPPFFGLAVALGLFSGGALTLVYTMGGLAVPPQHRATAFGFFSGAALFGGSVAPAVAGALARLDLRAVYWVDAALFLGLGLALAAARRSRQACGSMMP